MTIALSPSLTAEMNALTRTPGSAATVEKWLPSFTPLITGLTASKYEQYAHGHAAIVAANANGAGEDILFRARSGSLANPQDSGLYIAVIKGADLDNPAGWDAKWFSSGISGLMCPAWTASTWIEHGGSIAVAWTGSYFRVFYIGNYELKYADFNPSGGLVANAFISNTTYVPSLGTSTYQLASMQLASPSYTEVFILKTELVEASLAAWHKPVYGSNIHYIYQGGGIWYDAGGFPFHTHAEAALLRDGQFIYGSAGNEWGGGAAGDVMAQWGKRPCGGLAANHIDGSKVVVSAGFTYWKRYGYNTHNQGVQTFIYHRDSAQWERGVEVDVSDYVDERLDYALFARGSTIEGGNFLVWSRNVEPSDYDQLEAALSLPRTREVVYAKFDATGRALTQYQYLGSQDDLTSASLVVANHAGAKWLYALGWRAVYRSPAAAFLCSVPTPQNLELYVSGYKTQVNNRYGMSVDLSVEDASIAFLPGTDFEAGSLVRVYSGTTTEQIQIAQGLVDQINPVLSLQPEQHRAKVIARAEKGLLDPRSEELSDILPQNTVFIKPTDPVVHIANHAGYWEVAKLEWPTKFGIYPSLNGRLAYRLKSFPYAWTGGDQGYGYPGMVLDQRPRYKGTWFNDAAWTDMTPMVDGSVEATVRFGDVNNGANFDFYDRAGFHVFGTVTRGNSIINRIDWTATGVGLFNVVAQSACMGGLICHAAEMNKKFAFIWEANTTATTIYSGVDKVPVDWHGYPKPFSGSSHTDDTWKAETMDRCDYRGFTLGANMLYLVQSDYDDTDPNWIANSKWIHKVVVGGVTATGLTPGYPADLKMTVLGGTIFCFYRPHQLDGSAPAQWQYAFSYKAGRFGAGRFGIVGRGHAGIQWDGFYYAKFGSNLPTGRAIIPRYDNYVDIWDIKLSDCVVDRPMEEILRRRSWQGFTPTTFRSLVDVPGTTTVGSGAVVAYAPPVENLTIDFKVSTSAMGVEAGIVLRAVNGISLASERHIRMGLVTGGGLPGAAGVAPTYLVKRAYNASGVEVVTEREYSPFPLYLHNTWPVPVRVTVRGNIYSMWVAGNYAGHFVDSTAGGVYFGLYSTGGTASFTKVYVPELYEVPEMSSLDINQTLFDAIKKMISKRAIKGVFQPTGALKFSYFEMHDTGPTFQDSLKQSALRISDRFASIVRVDGAYTWAVYASEVLMAQGRRFMQESFPDIFHREFAWREAKAICRRLAEEQVQSTFVGLPDLRVQPEDQIEIFVDQQSLAGHYLVDDVSIDFQNGDDPDMNTTISTRRSVAI